MLSQQINWANSDIITVSDKTNLTIRIRFLEAICSIHIIGSCVMFASCFCMEGGCFTEGISSRTPLFCHFKHICCSLIAFHRFFYFRGSPERIANNKEDLLTCIVIKDDQAVYCNNFLSISQSRLLKNIISFTLYFKVNFKNWVLIYGSKKCGFANQQLI